MGVACLSYVHALARVVVAEIEVLNIVCAKRRRATKIVRRFSAKTEPLRFCYGAFQHLLAKLSIHSYLSPRILGLFSIEALNVGPVAGPRCR